MNERIRELAEQAEKYASQKDRKYDGACNLNWQWQDIKMEKFAELIVQECVGRLVDMDQQVKGQHNYYKHASIQVLLHFGIQP
jgi:hypothetical protein